MSVEDHTVSFSLQVNVEEDTQKNLRQLQTVLYRTLSLLRRMNLPPEVDKAINMVQRLIAVLNQIRLLMIMISALNASSGVLGLALVLVSIGTTAASGADLLQGY